MSCDQCTMDHNGNKLNDCSFTFCVIHGTDYMTFCSHFMAYVLHVCFKHLCILCMCNVICNFFVVVVYL